MSGAIDWRLLQQDNRSRQLEVLALQLDGVWKRNYESTTEKTVCRELRSATNLESAPDQKQGEAVSEEKGREVAPGG